MPVLWVSMPEEPVLYYRTISELGSLYENKETTPTEVTNSFLNRIAQHDGHLLSYATVLHDRALDQAALLTEELNAGKVRGPLHGIPLAVKDLCDMSGVPSMGGTAVLENNVPRNDSTVIDRLQNAGAVILGKLNLTEGAMGGYNPRRDVPRNPWNPGKWAGSSSSGSAVATAAGLCVGSLGSDTGGSIRFPSAACGIVGLKPSYGRVSRFGVLDLAETLDHVGPMTRSVSDAIEIFKCIAGHDSKDKTTRCEPVPSFDFDVRGDLSGVVIGYSPDYCEKGVNSEIVKRVLEAKSVFGALGAEFREINFPDIDPYLPSWKTICSAEAANAHRDHFPSRSSEYGLWFREWLEHGRQVTVDDYIDASRTRSECNGVIREKFENVDAFLCPTTINLPHDVDDSVSYGPMDNLRGTSFQRFTVPFDFNGYPTVTLPCGFSDTGMPISMQIVGKSLSEEKICRIALEYEKHSDLSYRHPVIS